MIKDRLYEPAPGEVLYHYCDDLGFRGIINSKTIWATAFYALNDPSERKWGVTAFVESVRRLERIVSKDFMGQVAAIVNHAHLHSMLMVCSLSLHSDSKNQWQRYAGQGKGFCIGFSANALRLPAKPLRILYDPEAQVQEICANLDHVHEVQKKLGFPHEEEFQRHCFHLGLDLCAYKDPAFREENEIRYAHIAGAISAGNAVRIIPLGARGPDGQRLSQPRETLFRERDGHKIPYVTLDWTDNGKMSPITTVTLGSNNPAVEEDIRAFLDSQGLSGVRIARSSVRLD